MTRQARFALSAASFDQGGEGSSRPEPRDYLGAISRLVSSFSERGRKTLGRILPPSLPDWTNGRGAPAQTMLSLARALLSARGEASGVAIAQDMLELYALCTPEDKTAFFSGLAHDLGPDREAIEGAWKLYQAEGESRLAYLSRAVEAPRQELFRRLNFAPGGTEALVALRADLLHSAKTDGALRQQVDADLRHVLESWFNRGFLTMRPIDWSSPARQAFPSGSS